MLHIYKKKRNEALGKIYTNWRKNCVYKPVHIGPILYKAFNDWQFASNGSAPKWSYIVNRTIVRDFIFATLFDVCIANSDEVFNNLYIAFLASDKEWSTSFFHSACYVSSLWLVESLQSYSEGVGETSCWWSQLAFLV